jgi:mannose-6-phosphate isomerase-like protein (cupin superfamily)
MVLEPGATEGGPDNAHRGSDQWLYVLSGRGSATIGGRRQDLKSGTLVLIERGVTHEIRNAGRAPLKTVNLYVPPAYSASGRTLSRGRP